MSWVVSPARGRDAAEIVATPVLTETFDHNEREWALSGGKNSWSGRITAGVLSVENRSVDEPAASLRELTVSARRRPELSLDVAFPAGDTKSVAGLHWSGTAGARDGQYFRIEAAGRFRIGTRVDGVDRDTKVGSAGPLATEGKFNRLVWRMLGEQTVFFVNGRVVWIAPTVPLEGAHCGVWAAPGSTVEFDNFQLGYLRSDETTVAARLVAYQAAAGDLTKVFLDTPVTGSHGTTAVEAALQNRAQAAAALEQSQQFEAAAKIYREILQRSPADGPAHARLAVCLLHLGQLPDATKHAEVAVGLEPLSLAPRLVQACIASASGDAPTAEAALRHAVLLDHEFGAEGALEKITGPLVAKPSGAPWVPALRMQLAAAGRARHPAFKASLDALTRASAALSRRNFVAAEQECRIATEAASGVAKLTSASGMPSPAEREFFIACVHQAAGALLGGSDDLRRALPFLEEAFGRLRSSTLPIAAFTRARNAATLAAAANQTANPQRAKEIVNAALPGALALPDAAAPLRAELLAAGCAATNQLQQNTELRSFAQRLLQVRGTGDDARFQALAHNFIGASYAASTLPPDRQTARSSFERALQLARDAGAGELASSVAANLGISYWQAGDRKRAREIYEDLAARAERSGDLAAAEEALNNLGAMHYYAQDYRGAAEIFRRAVDLTETARSRVSGEEQIRLMAARLSAYQFLVASLQRTGDNTSLFAAENAFRARSLAQTLNLGAPPAATSLAQFQQGLATDEAAVFYTLLSAGEIVAHVVTRERAVPVQHADFARFMALKKRYLDRLNKGRAGYKPVQEVASAGGVSYTQRDPATQIGMGDFEAMVELTRSLIEPGTDVTPELRERLLKEFLGAFRALLIAPVEAQLAGRKKLLLFPDGILYFLPFELLPDAGGRMLIQNFDVRYCQSAAVWRALRERNYPSGRRPFFAMGGAIYHAMSETAPPAEDAARMVQLQIQAQRNTAAGKPQREVYAALFGAKPMSYLKGSLIEVQALTKTFPGAVVFTGQDMNENRLKAMARDGSLKTFQIVHLATHGFALPEVPELSGVAMSIFPTMQDGEDGYLTAPEIAQLGMQADIAVLSACQTALGRIYGGEGVAGLTGALLVGGANRALVSLWPVSDAGTMRFMRELYALTVGGASYADAVNTVKRRFISGDYGAEFRDAYIWAPFVLYGP